MTTRTREHASPDTPTTRRLLIACADARGVVAAVAAHLSDRGANLVDADQHTDTQHGQFFMRVVYEPKPGDDGTLASDDTDWHAIVDRFALHWSVRAEADTRRVAILAGPETHCLSDLLWRWSVGELDADLRCVISNHETGRAMTETVGVPFHHMPVTKETKPEQERAVIERLEREGVELVVLARYMQVLSPAFVQRFPGQMINIHHSFLPAFAGARPYHQAFERGVKLIGATSHYVTEVLDDGPIIAQETTPVNHRHAIEDLVRRGRDLERVVLARAVRLHLADKVLVSGRKTVVFA